MTEGAEIEDLRGNLGPQVLVVRGDDRRNLGRAEPCSFLVSLQHPYLHQSQQC